MKNPGTYTFIVIVGLLMVFSACRKDYYVAPDVEITETVSFADDILPIFNENCNTSGCHNTGGIPPDLSPATAYDNLFLYNVVDTINPEESLIYIAMSSSGDPMPPSGILDPVKIATVLAWIDQGGQNN